MLADIVLARQWICTFAMVLANGCLDKAASVGPDDGPAAIAELAVIPPRPTAETVFPEVHDDDSLRGKQAAMYRLVVAHAWEQVAANLSEEEWRLVSNVRIELNEKNDRPYDFFSISGLDGQRPLIQLSIGGLRSAHFVCEAMAINEKLFNGQDSLFFGHYAIYVARSRSITNCLPPWVVLGWSASDIPEDVSALAHERLIECFYFILAHEVAHVLNAHASCSSFETDLKTLALSRLRESEADQFAFELLYKMGYAPLPICQLFLAWATSIEGMEEKPGIATHPAELHRLAAAVDFAVAITEVRQLPAPVKAEMAELRLGLYKAMLIWEDPTLRAEIRKNISGFKEEWLRRPVPKLGK